MNKIQEKLLKVIDEQNLSGMTLREIGNLVGEHSAQKIKHHLSQLDKKGFITYNSLSKEIKRISELTKDGLLSLPVVGSANCGPANILANENITAYLKVSKKIVPNTGKLFVLQADGDSMNKAQINGRLTIDTGDFVIVDSMQKNPKSGDYVVSIIDDCANIKKFTQDKKNKRIILQSESTKKYLPIFIHESDNYNISGKVINVIKN